jgi:hypothetical protein
MVSLAARLTWQRLYDRRASCSPVQSFYDPIDTESAIYSLASFGQERFLAGSANSRLKIFDFRGSSKVYHYTDGLECSGFSPSPKPISRLGDNIEGENRDCHHDFRTDIVRTCHFHTLSRMDIYRRNATIFLYGAPRHLGPHTRAMSGHENSPIFSLSSPDPVCPVVYAGTTGRVYELEISETDHDGNLLDPYFAAPPGAGLAKQVHELAMYEMDEGDSSYHTPFLWVQPEGRRTRNRRLRGKSRLDSRW